MLLTQQDREKFSAWLDQEAESDNIIAEELIKIGHVEMGKRKKQRAATFSIVSEELKRIEDMTI